MPRRAASSRPRGNACPSRGAGSSAIPNPRNWGPRADGSPALLDWELFGPGVPATDLTVIVADLGDTAAFTAVADCYIAIRDAPLPWSWETLARDIAIVKVGRAVRLLHGHATGATRVDGELLTWLIGAVPGWVQRLV